MISCFHTDCIYKNDMKLIFLYLIANCDIMFFANCIYKNDIKIFVMSYFHLIADIKIS